ncbi:hypothetical protein [Aquabacterium parvum]|jgi:hypothetical protein|uniref:hypothetical protein n=1 Tax=Aquabacterium parvum TaxID=70584 RepID=UPI000718D8EC|nr:hypothetical protein [Aquabacterium parvum]
MHAPNASLLTESLTQALDPAQPLYILVDPIAGEPVALAEVDEADLQALQSARSSSWGTEVLAIKLPSRIDLPTHLHPYLVMPERLSATCVQLSWELAQRELQASHSGGVGGSGQAVHRIGAWLQSGRNPREVAEHLALLMLLDTEVHTKASYLRLADRRAFAWLRHVLGDDVLSVHMGPVGRWLYLGASGRIERLVGHGASSQPSRPRITTEQWKLMEQGPRVHRVLARALGQLAMDAEPPRASDEATLFQLAGPAVQEALAAASMHPNALQTDDDLTAWASLTLLLPHWATDPRGQKLIAHAAQPDTPTMHTLVTDVRLACQA